MSGFGEIHAEQQRQDDDAECWMHHETSRCDEVLDEIKCFVKSGVISESEVIQAIRGITNERQ